MKLIRIFSATLIASSLAFGASVAPAQAAARRQVKPQTVALFLGDSYSVGVGATPWTNGFVYKVAEYYGWRAENYSARAVGYLKGNTAESQPRISTCLSPQGCRPLWQQFDFAIASGVRPDVVFVSGGRNDVPSDAFAPAVRALLQRIKLTLPNAKIVVTSPINYGPETQEMADKVAVVRAAALEAGVMFIDLGSPLLTHSGLLYRDQIHPSNKGYERLAHIIEARLNESAYLAKP